MSGKEQRWKRRHLVLFFEAASIVKSEEGEFHHFHLKPQPKRFNLPRPVTSSPFNI